MDTNSHYQIIKRLRTSLPRGVPFGLTTLAPLGVSAPLVAHYVECGWLVRLLHGVYAFPNDDVGVYGMLKFLQQRVPGGLHIGGKSALAMQGVQHKLNSHDTLVLWGNTHFALPAWFTSRFPARYAHASLFDWPDDMLASKTVTTPPGLPDGLRVSTSERAVLELLYEAGTNRQNLEEARKLFVDVRSPREELLGQLLACCTSIKTVRLFLTWARETELVDVDDLLARYPLRIGSDKCWISRLADGTLLRLNPRG